MAVIITFNRSTFELPSDSRSLQRKASLTSVTDLLHLRFNNSSLSYNNQSIKIYIAPLQDPYSEVLPTQAKQKRIEKRRRLGSYSAVDIIHRSSKLESSMTFWLSIYNGQQWHAEGGATAPGIQPGGTSKDGFF